MATQKEKRKLNPRHLAVKEQKRMKTLMIGFIITSVIIVGLIAFAVIYSVFLKDNIAVATVNGEKIDNEYFKARVRLERNGYIQQFMLLNTQAQIFADDPTQTQYYQNQMMQISSALDNVAIFGELVLESVIEDEIIAIKGREMGLDVTEAEIDALFGRVFNYFPNGTPTPAPTRAPFTEPTLSPTQDAILQLEPTTVVDALEINPEGGVDAIITPEGENTEAQPTATQQAAEPTPSATATPYTEEMFQAEYDKYIADLNEINVGEKYIRMYLYHYLIKQKVQEAIFAQVPAEQEQVWARHILVPTESEALDVLKRLENGEKWADVAAEVSLDTSNKDKGGDLGWFSPGQMVTEFNDAAFRLEVGEVSAPVKTQFGWHLIQLVNRAVLPLTPTDLQNKQGQAYQTWLAEAKESIPYQINDVYRDLSPADPSIAQVFATLQAAQTEVPAE